MKDWFKKKEKRRDFLIKIHYACRDISDSKNSMKTNFYTLIILTK